MLKKIKFSKKTLIIALLVFMVIALFLMFIISRFSTSQEEQKTTTQTETITTPNIESLKKQAQEYCEIFYSDQSKQSETFLNLLTSESRQFRQSEETASGGTGVKISDFDVPEVREVKVTKQTVTKQTDKSVSIKNDVTIRYKNSAKQWYKKQSLTIIFKPENNQWLIDELAILGYTE